MSVDVGSGPLSITAGEPCVFRTSWKNTPGKVDISVTVDRPPSIETIVTVRSCRYGAVLRACQMAIDADLNGVIANVRNGVGHWKRMATRLARTLAEPQARSGTGRTERRAAATSGPKYRHDRTVTNNRLAVLIMPGHDAVNFRFMHWIGPLLFKEAGIVSLDFSTRKFQPNCG